MGAMKANPRYNVVSIRVSDEELEALQETCRQCNMSVSTIMREAMRMIRNRERSRFRPADGVDSGEAPYDGQQRSGVR